MKPLVFLALIIFLVTSVLPLPAVQEQKRDLKIEKVPVEAGTGPPTATMVIPRSYALVVGISQYRNLPAKLQLQFANRDAEAIYSILISPEGGNFRTENVHKLIGTEATRERLRHELETWLPSVAAEDDRVLIYFAGHGFIYNGKGYLAPHDFDPNNIPGTGYLMDNLGVVVGSKIRAKNKVLLTDACHSGAITPGTDTNSVTSALLNINKSLFSLTASRDREQSFESPDWGGGHGIFTYYVVKGLEGEADENRNGVVTADELAEYVRRNVRDATTARQNPTSDRGSFDPNLPLSYIPKILAGRAPAAAKADFGTLVFESNMDGVEVFVNGQSAGIVDKGKPLKLQGLRPGAHTIKAVKMGYEPDGPREEMVYPGQETTVSIKILIVRRRSKAALDLLDKGLEYYNKGYADNYKRAAEQFEKALALDSTYSQAALYLGRTYNALFDEDKATKYFRRAIEIDPDYLEARASFAGMLLDIGDVDEAIRQLNVVVQHDPGNALALRMLAQSYRMKEMYPQSIEAAQKSIQVEPRVAETHFWLAESLRMSSKYEPSKLQYLQYLQLSDYESKLAGKMNYYVVGFLVGMGKKKRAAQQDIWKDLRSLAYFGLGDCERLLSQPDPAVEYYLKALSYDPEDPQIHYGLGLALYRKAEITQSAATLPEARKHFQAMLTINPDLIQAEKARKYLKVIDATLQGTQ